MTPKLLVVSPQAPDQPSLARSQRWFLDQTTRDYKLFTATEPSHMLGMKALSQVVTAQANNFERVLLLDSDAFPVHRDWQDILEVALEDSGRSYAAPVRAENLDLFPHPCFFYFKTQDWSEVSLYWRRGPGKTFRGRRRDVLANLPTHDLLPLMRSNYMSPHPLMHSIYGNVAYHRGGGSRAPKGNVRMKGTGYWENLRWKKSNPLPSSLAGLVNFLVGEDRFNARVFDIHMETQ